MTMPAIFLWAIVLAVGVPSAWRNPTAGALVLCKIAGWVIYRLTGDNLPVEYYLFPDIFVLIVIAMKPWRSPADWVVVAIFPVMWALYVSTLHPYYVWWALYYLVIAQFFAVGWDFAMSFRRVRPESDTSAPAPDDVFRRLAWARESG